MSDRSRGVLGFLIGALLGTYATFAIYDVSYPVYAPSYLEQVPQ